MVKTPSQLTILDVVNAVEPITRIRQCPLGLKTHVLPSSRLGPSIHSGTANGKFHGVTTATTPHGFRRVNDN
jgi:hypothetical protein